MDNELIVNRIIPFSNVDGQGNRCAIFLQGCNISCVYCHNPETINYCNHCGECLAGCKFGALSLINGEINFDKSKCIDCMTCIKSCRFNASPKVEKYFIHNLVQIIKSYQPFIRGITVSGGEPTLQKDAIVDLFKEVKKLGLTCYIDTNGFFSIEDTKELIEITDKFLFDVKTVGNSGILCHVENLSSLKTLEYLLNLNKVEEVRTVVISSFMEGKETITSVSGILKNYTDIPYKIIKVHDMGLKGSKLDMIKDHIPTDEDILGLVKIAEEIGLNKIKYVL